MIHQDHINLIKKGIPYEKGVWGDLGSGEGAFTLALADVLPIGSKIISLDKNPHSLQIQKEQFKKKFPETNIEFINANFTKKLNLPTLDGVVMANSLHFIPTNKQVPFLLQLKMYLKPQGRLIIIEYNTSNGNIWVPFNTITRKYKVIILKGNLRSHNYKIRRNYFLALFDFLEDL